MKRTAHQGDRVRAAKQALHAYCIATGADDDDEAIHDLIADLGHYADRHDIDFVDCAARAIGCWALERRKERDCTEAIPRVVIHIGDGGVS
jgi:uncharacterized protein (UPF0212 family)